MLKQRVITAIVLVAILLFALLAKNPLYWQCLVALVVALGLWEWLRLAKLDSMPFFALFYALMIVLYAVFATGKVPDIAILVPTCALWIGLIAVTLLDRPAVLMTPFVKALSGVWVLSASAWILLELKALPWGVGWILLCMSAIWCADIGAYFSGRRFGRHKLAPKVSPGKTIEGLIGGLLLVIIVYWLAATFLFNNTLFNNSMAVQLFPVVLITAGLSVFGDLYESKLKRAVDMKDSSQILPGHGGILDRIDSALIGLPVYMTGLHLAGVL